MLKNKENCPKSPYRIKLLADRNLVLVEANGYETEIFTPQVVDNRITLINVIPNRRCCKIGTPIPNDFFVSKNGNGKCDISNQQEIVIRGKALSIRYSNEQNAALMPTPLANSTPSNVKKDDKNSGSNFQNIGSSFTMSTPANARKDFSCGESYHRNSNLDFQATSSSSTLPTPEPVRRVATTRPYMLGKPLFNLPTGVKVARIYPTPHKNTPKNVGRIIASSSNISRLNSSFSLMTSPVIAHNATQNKTKSKRSVIESTDSGWLKVLTPLRNYTRTSKQRVMLQSPVKIASVNSIKCNKPLKLRPTYLINPTQGPNVTKCIIIKRVRLIKDIKLCISPKSFKKQQQETFGNCHTKPEIVALPKSRTCRDIWAMSAFDLLTNSNRSRCLSSKLKEQFRRGCVNKASSTYSKYKILSTIPPLQEDEQVLEISRIAMRAEEISN